MTNLPFPYIIIVRFISSPITMVENQTENHRFNKRETLRKFRQNLVSPAWTLKLKIRKLKYISVILLALLASCNRGTHTPEYNKAEQELDAAKAILDRAEENMKNAEDYEDALNDVKEAQERLDEATKKVNELHGELPHDQDTTPSEGNGRDQRFPR